MNQKCGKGAHKILTVDSLYLIIIVCANKHSPLWENLIISEEKLMKMKRTLSMALALCLMFGSAAALPEGTFTQSTSITASAETLISGDFEYTLLDDGTINIFKYTGNETELEIPSKIDNKTVTSLSMYSFYNCTSLITVIIPNSVTYIGDEAFQGCSNLKSISLPDSINFISQSCFQDCNSLKSIIIPSGIKHILDNAFYNCTSLTKIEIPDGVTSIGDRVFYSCKNLKTILIPSTVTQIGYWAFENTQWLDNRKNKNPLVRVNNIVIDGTSCFGEISIPNKTIRINACAFIWCEAIKKVSIPDSVTSIGQEAFRGCRNLEGILLPNSVNTISALAFFDCDSVKSITIPKNVTSISDYAFGYKNDDNGYEVKIKDFKISCYKGTAGEKYAIDNEFDYELLDVEHVEAKAATCGEDGNIEYWTYDGKFYSDEKATTEITEQETIVKKTEHTFGEWETVVAPTCTQKGSESRKCSVCGEEETREIDALGHKFEDSWTVTKEATCTQAGSEERICTVCGGNEEGGKETREIKAKGHKFGKEWTVVRTASAGMPSLKVKYCENCKGEEEGGKLEKEGSSVLEKERVFGDNRFKTSLAIADQFKNANNGKAFENIIVASGADFADALSASYLAKVKNAPILLVANKATVVINETIEYIKKNAAAGANVYLVGGSSVVPNSMITDLKKLGFKAKRLAGSNRYDTNIEVLKEAGVTNEKILIASGMDYADALSASAVGLPILLVAGKGKSLTPNQKAYLQSLKDVKVEKGAAPLSKAYIIGGTGAVSAGILKQAKEIFAAAYRVAGSNRYETSVKVAETFFKKETPKTVAVAYGMNYPDGLCGGPLAIAYKCPLILTVNQKPDAAVAYAKSIKAASVVAFGGKQLISVETMNKILGK